MQRKVQCTVCGTTKSLKQFYSNKASSNGRQSHCKDCDKKKQKERYASDAAYRERRRANARKRNKELKPNSTLAKRIANQKIILKFLKDNGCVDCGCKDPLVLEFDHIKEKSMGVSKMMSLGFSLEKIFEEISKCQIRCANCHRRKTARERQYYKHINIDNL